jgi:hypothetical protein
LEKNTPSVRLIDQSDIDACNEYHNSKYNLNRTRVQWEWEFLQGKDSQIPFAEILDEGKIAGTQALIPIRMVDGQGEFLTAKSEETYLDYSVRGKDSFKRLYEPLIEYAESHGMAAIWGFTSAIKAFQRLQFVVPGSTTQLFMPFSPKALNVLMQWNSETSDSKTALSPKLFWGIRAASLYSSLALLSASIWVKKVTLKALDEAPQDAGQLCQRFIEQWGGTTIMRDAQFLKWRFFDNPYLKVMVVGAYQQEKLVGWIAYSLDHQSIGYIVDTMVAAEAGRAESEKILAALLKRATLDLKRKGALGIRGWHVNNHPFDLAIKKIARRMGYFHVKQGEPMVLRILPAGLQRPVLSNFDDWYISRAFTEGLLG